MAAFKDYYELAKPGLVYGNIVTVTAGFFLAAHVYGGAAGSGLAAVVAHIGVFAATVVGIFLVMASGCVFNNYIDRDIDRFMERTKNRALVTGRITGRAARAYGVVLGIAGFAILAYYTNLLAVFAAAVGFFFYVFMYSMWWKRKSPWGTFVGALAGATPPVVGYTAFGGRLDLAALLLFVMLVVWQMPHFYAIAIRRFGEYMAAGVPVLPVKKGIPATKVQILVFIIIFALTVPLLTVFGYTGYDYLTIALVCVAVWLALAVRGFENVGPGADVHWARTMFLSSLAVMVVVFLTIAVVSLF